MFIGRPSNHLRGFWIAVDKPDGIDMYQLDERGHLVVTDGEVRVHHRVQRDVSVFDEPVEICTIPRREPSPDPFFWDMDIAADCDESFENSS